MKLEEFTHPFAALERPLKVAIAAVFAWMLLLTIGLTVALLAQSHQNGRIEDASAKAVRVSAVASELVADQAQARTDALKRTCDEANDRHESTREGLHLIVRGTPRNAKLTIAQQRQAQHFFNVFLAGIAPRYDCKVRVAELAR